jgi:DNA-binding transcriptional LysR family regulator
MFIWDDLKHFLAFARGGSMLAAAKAQGVNHSTVYRRLAELERRLGCKLVQRHLTGYRLTKVGLGLLPHAEHVEEAVAACERYLASHDRTPTGMLRVTCNPVAGNRLGGTSLFETFHKRFPDLRVELVMSDKIFDLSKGSRCCNPKSNRPQGRGPCARRAEDRGADLGSLCEPLIC